MAPIIEQQAAEPTGAAWLPALGEPVVDLASGRTGEFRGEAGGRWWLRPRGGGVEWDADPRLVRSAVAPYGEPLHGFRCLEPGPDGVPCGAESGLAEGEERAGRWLRTHQAAYPGHQAFVHICHRSGAPRAEGLGALTGSPAAG
ncbi:hypothetical protein [Kitasatospora sp. NPDC094015]|uniref:DUF7848 domain-containing protein n=1 Tax=Kitasatospora sp. NPDC094015 TaxID=3155205 RepID=UPI00331C326F